MISGNLSNEEGKSLQNVDFLRAALWNGLQKGNLRKTVFELALMQNTYFEHCRKKYSRPPLITFLINKLTLSLMSLHLFLWQRMAGDSAL